MVHAWSLLGTHHFWTKTDNCSNETFSQSRFLMPISLRLFAMQIYILNSFGVKLVFVASLTLSTSAPMFLVGAFLVKSARLLQWLVFFLFLFFVRPQTSSRMYHFLQKLIKLLRLLRPSPANANLVQRVSPFNFFRHCATFFENFLMSQKSPPFEFFDILQHNIC